MKMSVMDTSTQIGFLSRLIALSSLLKDLFSILKLNSSKCSSLTTSNAWRCYAISYKMVKLDASTTLMTARFIPYKDLLML